MSTPESLAHLRSACYPAPTIVRIRELTVHNIKILDDQTFSFSDSSGELRNWTALLGDNGMCKTTILQAIALAASGDRIAGILVEDAADYVRQDRLDEDAFISAKFETREGPLSVTLTVRPGHHSFRGNDDANRVDDIRDTIIKVPLLGDIPILGEAFKRTNKVNNKSRLYIFLTPRIMTDPNFNDIRLFTEGPQRDMSIDPLTPTLEPEIIQSVEQPKQGLPETPWGEVERAPAAEEGAPSLDPVFIEVKPTTNASGSSD